MGLEIDVDSILTYVQHKCARNSLLNVPTRVPPELLEYTFRWNIIPLQLPLHLSLLVRSRF